MLTKIDTARLSQHAALLQDELKEIMHLEDALKSATDAELDPQIIFNLQRQLNAVLTLHQHIEDRFSWIEQTASVISNTVHKAEGSLSDALQIVKTV